MSIDTNYWLGRGSNLGRTVRHRYGDVALCDWATSSLFSFREWKLLANAHLQLKTSVRAECCSCSPRADPEVTHDEC